MGHIAEHPLAALPGLLGRQHPDLAERHAQPASQLRVERANAGRLDPHDEAGQTAIADLEGLLGGLSGRAREQPRSDDCAHNSGPELVRRG